MTNEHVRLATARRLALQLDLETTDYVHLTRLAAAALRAPTAYLALLDGPQPHYLSAVGLPQEPASYATLSAAFCQQITVSGRLQTVADARHQPELRHASSEAELIALIGVPLRAEGDVIVGALCVADRVPREWSAAERGMLEDLAATIQREISLCEREARCQIFLNEQTNLICRYLPDGRLTFVNDACTQLLGQSRAALLGSDVRRWLAPPPHDSQTIGVLCREPATAEERLLRLPDGSRRWIQWIERPILNSAGRLVELQATGHDITERKQAEDALRASEERFRALSGSSPVGIFLADNEGRCLYGNPRMQAITTLSIDYLLGNSWIELIHPDDVERVVREWREYAAAGLEQVTEYRLRLPDSSVRWIRSRNAPLHDDAGRLVGHVGTIEDITERHEIMEALRVSEERFRLAVTTIPCPLIMYDAELRIQLINPPALALTDASEAEVLGHTDREVFGPEILEHYLATLQRCAAERTTQRTECTFKRASGDRTFLLSYVPLLDMQGQLRQILGIAYDISERSRAEQQRMALERKLLETQKLESLGVLAGGIAHDFNNLLGAILGNADLALLDLEPDSSPYESVAQIQLATRRAADLTQQMLAYSGRGRFVVQLVDINALIQEMYRLLSASIDRTSTVHYELAPNLPPLLADVTQLRQVVMNLLTNAAEAIGERGGVITVATALVQVSGDQPIGREMLWELPAGQYIALSVSDTGSGMSPATLAKIFDPFFTTKFTGRGLGLAAVQGIVRGHHGTLNVESTPGSGTTFTILLPPVADADQYIAAPPPQHTPADRDWHGYGTVLVVDDEPSVRTTAARALERFGFTVLLASDGRAGVELFRTHAATISYVLLDLTMPRLSGAQALDAMRAINPAVRIVVMSGYDEEEVLDRFGNAAPDGFLHKPFLPNELQLALQGAVQQRGTALA